MLNVLSREDAVRIIKEKTACFLPTETVPLPQSLGRVLSRDLISEENVPSFHRTTVDGYAVCAADTFGAGASIPAQLEIAGEILMGEPARFPLRSGQCVKISTGGMLPEGADAAVMVEQTDDADGLCLVYKSVAPYENITRAGDDIAKGEIALKQGVRITAAQIGVLAALGVTEVPVRKQPAVAVISTGDELVGGTPQAGQIRDVNTFLLAAALRDFGCRVVEFGAVRDDRTQIETALREALTVADAVIISGGSSAGTRDLTVEILSSLGEVCFHGLAMKPGKPTIFGVAAGKPVFGLPGHPLAAYFVFRLIVSEYLRHILRLPADQPIRCGALAVNIPSNHGREEFLCVRFDRDLVVPVHSKSGVISVLSQTQGFLRISRDCEGLSQGTTVEVYQL